MSEVGFIPTPLLPQVSLPSLSSAADNPDNMCLISRESLAVAFTYAAAAGSGVFAVTLTTTAEQKFIQNLYRELLCTTYGISKNKQQRRGLHRRQIRISNSNESQIPATNRRYRHAYLRRKLYSFQEKSKWLRHPHRQATRYQYMMCIFPPFEIFVFHSTRCRIVILVRVEVNS